MFSDLAFIDWIALAFAAVLLTAAAAAAIVAYASAKDRPVRAANPILGHRPAHAAPSSSASVFSSRSDSAPRHSFSSRTDVAPTNGSPTALLSRSAPDQAHGEPVVAGVPQPPVISSASLLNRAVIDDGIHIEPSAAKHESVAARAAKLRNRPIPDTGRKRVVSSVEPQRTPAHAPNRGVVAEKPDNNIEMGRGQGFAARTPGFFEDPVGRHELRYWDGHRWTEYVKEHGERFVDPL